MLDINMGATRDKFPLNLARRDSLIRALYRPYCALASQLDIAHEDNFSLTIRIFSTSPAAPMLGAIVYDSIEQPLNPHCPDSRKGNR